MNCLAADAVHPHFKALLGVTDFVLFFQGACHAFALALHERFRYDMVLLKGPNCEPSQGTPHVLHVYCRFEEYAVDAKGFVLETDLLEEYRVPRNPDFKAIPISTHHLNGYYVDRFPGGGLYANRAFMKAARIRAMRHIEKSLCHFDGSLRRELAGPPRLDRTTGAELFD